MKKTQKTLLTAVALTAATLNPNSVGLVSSNTIELMSALYGPPPAKVYEQGDINRDNKINVLDYCLMLNSANGNGTVYEENKSDINLDGVIDINDFNSLRNYLFGTVNEVVPIVEEPMQVDYEFFHTTDSDEAE